MCGWRSGRGLFDWAVRGFSWKLCNRLALIPITWLQKCHSQSILTPDGSETDHCVLAVGPKLSHEVKIHLFITIHWSEGLWLTCIHIRFLKIERQDKWSQGCPYRLHYGRVPIILIMDGVNYLYNAAITIMKCLFGKDEALMKDYL